MTTGAAVPMRRDPTGALLGRTAGILAIGLAIYHLYGAVLGAPVAIIHRAVHLGGMALIAYLAFAAQPQTTRSRRWTLLVLGALSIATTVYLIVSFRALMFRVGMLSTLDMAAAIVCVAIVFDLARRTHGWPLVITSIVFLIYGLAGRLVPGQLAHRGYAPDEILEFLYTTTEGIFGVPLQVSASYIVVFVIFSAFLERSGIVGLFNDLAFAITGRSRGGVAKVAVVSSALMGTVSGSGLANVTTTGAVTIPLMIRNGFERHYAAAVEATASMGGQIMPPVMGVAAFLMAERLGVPYSRIALAAIIPAVLYFFATGVQIHLHAARQQIQPPATLPRRLWEVLRADGYLVLPVFVLIGLMMRGHSPLYGAVASIAATLAMSWIASAVVAARTRAVAPGGRRAAFLTEARRRSATLAGILESLEFGIRNSIGVATACAIVGVIVGIVTLTGAGLKLSSAIIAAAGGLLVPTLVLTMLACFILGMGLPTIPTYIITSTMAAPALTKLGVDRLAADFFVMYFGVLANLTPPVALAAYAAAGMARADPMKTAFAAIKLSVAGFLVPYIFVYSPIMLGVGFNLPEIVQVIVTSTAGVIALGAAMEGHLLCETKWYERLLLIAAAVDLIIPGLITDVIGAALFMVILVSQRTRMRHTSAAPALAKYEVPEAD